MRARRVTRSRTETERAENRPALRWAWPLLAVLAVVVLCGFTLYWTQSKVDAVSGRLEGLERSVEAAVGRQSSGQAGQADTPVVPTGPDAVQPSTPGPVRLARIVKCDSSENLVAVTYDPAQLFTGADAVRLAAAYGEAVTGDAYIFDPTKDVFVGQAPVNAMLTVHRAPAGWTGPAPTTVAELATDLQAAGGQAWLEEYFWLQFNQEYIVSIEQYEETAAP
jgi:hypothetical protein